MASKSQFSINGRIYTISIDAKKKVLTIGNPDGEAIETVRGNRTLTRITNSGERLLIDLETDPNAQFFGSLIDQAWQAQIAEDDSVFFKEATADYEEDTNHLRGTLNIAVIGKVSSGKSSLINALLMRARHNPVAKVGVEAGVTSSLKILKLDENVRLIDSPGIDDIKKENSEVTRDFLSSIDIGILVVTGAANESQKKIFDDLRQRCGGVFVVLNKIDTYDDYNKGALDKVINQWGSCLNADTIYPVCTFGYDPDLPIPLN
jgi:small GTP-binding protein